MNMEHLYKMKMAIYIIYLINMKRWEKVNDAFCK